MIRLLKDLAAFVIGLVEILLVVRFVLRLMAVNPAVGIAAWVYETTAPLLSPFVYVFPTPSVRGGFVLEFVTLFALFAYAFMGYLIQELLDILDRRNP